MKVSLITLSENTAAVSRGKAEWGLSFLLQIDDRTILFDTGAGSILLENAALMGVELEKIDQIVLSHGHYDHTGGLVPLLDKIGGRPIIAHPAIWEPKYAGSPNELGADYIGIPYTKEKLEAKGAVFHFSREPYAIAEGIMTTGEVEMSTPFESIEPGILAEQGGQLVPDPLEDDLSLVIQTPKGLVVILGCAHRGIINHLRQAQRITGEKRIYAVVGGTHLKSASDDRIESTIAELKQMDVQKIGVSHCTGFRASAKMYQVFGKRFFLNNAGTKWRLIG